MKRAPLYSSTVRAPVAPDETARAVPPPASPTGASTAPAGWRARLRALAQRRHRVLLFAGGVLCALLPVLVFWWLQHEPQELTQEDIDAAVIHTLENKSLPSRSAKAAELVRQSVVKVRGFLDEASPEAKAAPGAKGGKPPARDGARPPDKDAGKGPSRDQANRDQAKEPSKDQARDRTRPLSRDHARADTPPPPKARSGAAAPGAGKPEGNAEDKKDPAKGKAKGKPDAEEHEVSIGSGVVILDKGVILTNLHVIAGAKRLTVTFFDGMEADADIVGVFPENDLAVLQARRIPDDLPAATIGSSRRLKPGDEVVAVGFPFDIGPSVSAGVVSGLNREFRSPHGERVLTKLIQFDAAANSGNSGGPLVTMDGEVVGIVTAILNPRGAGTFIGIGFAVTIEGAGAAVGIAPF